MNLKSLGFLGFIIANLLPIQPGFANFPLSIISLQFPKAVDRGAPKATSGAGTRGKSCLLANEHLIALTPTQESTTVSANPTFFVYIPKSQAEKGDFVLVDGKGKDVYVSTIDLPSTQRRKLGYPLESQFLEKKYAKNSRTDHSSRRNRKRKARSLTESP